VHRGEVINDSEAWKCASSEEWITPVNEASKSGSRSLSVFLCHSSGDKPVVRDLYRKLEADAVDAWFDEENILPGQDWDLEINKAVRESDAVIVCLSRSSVTKEGYVQREIRAVLGVADEKPEGIIFLIPLKLEECEVPEKLRRYQWAELFAQRGYEKLLQALRVRASQVEAVAAAQATSQQETKRAFPIADVPQKQDELDGVLTLLLRPEERNHLIRLDQGGTNNYVGRHSLREELRRLRAPDSSEVIQAGTSGKWPITGDLI
jgi:TIR domain